MKLQSETELIPQVVQWVREHRLSNGNGHASHGHTEISQSTNLLESGALDSFGFVELLLFIEDLCGSNIDLQDVDPGDFTVVGNLCRIALQQRSAESSYADHY
jgi:acyl carrier protein